MLDSCSRARDILSGKTDPSKRLRCHLGLNVCSEIVSASGYPLAVCTGGKFIEKGEETLVKKTAEKIKETGCAVIRAKTGSSPMHNKGWLL